MSTMNKSYKIPKEELNGEHKTLTMNGLSIKILFENYKGAHNEKSPIYLNYRYFSYIYYQSFYPVIYVYQRWKMHNLP